MKFVLLAIILGFIFDVMSFLYGVVGIIKRKNISGFPLIGLVCYTVAIASAYIYIISQDAELVPTREPIDIDLLLAIPLYYMAIFLLVLHIFAQMPALIARKFTNTES